MGLKYNKEIILAIKKEFQTSKLKSKIVCLIIHGSGFFYQLDDNKSDSDIDIELVLSRQNQNDYQIIKGIVLRSKLRIECQLRYLNEVETKKSLISFSSYKVFMYFAYANGLCLIGKNIYKDLIKNIPYETIKKSLLISMQIYFKDIRKSFFRGDNAYWVNKNISYALLDICLAENFLDYRQLGKEAILREEKYGFVRPIIKNYSRFLNERDKKVLAVFPGKYRNKEIYEEIFSVVNKIFMIFEKNYLNKHT